MGSLNIFSLLFNKILEFVFKEGGIRYNVLIMRLRARSAAWEFSYSQNNLFVHAGYPIAMPSGFEFLSA